MVVSDTMDMLDWVTMAMLGILAMVMVSMVLAMLTTMESARLKQILRLTLPYFTAPMAMVLVTMAMLGWDIMGMLVLVITDMLVWDILDIPPIMGSVQHKQRSNN